MNRARAALCGLALALGAAGAAADPIEMMFVRCVERLTETYRAAGAEFPDLYTESEMESTLHKLRIMRENPAGVFLLSPKSKRAIVVETCVMAGNMEADLEKRRRNRGGAQ